VSANGKFALDLNHGHDAMLARLAATKFALNDMHIEPADARIAKLSPQIVGRRLETLGRGGISPTMVRAPFAPGGGRAPRHARAL
jgi:hypothetical protein